MIIDMHRHLWSVGQRHHAAFAQFNLVSGPAPTFDPEQAVLETMAETDDAGVDKTVLLVGDFEARLGPAPFSIYEENRQIAEAVRKYPGKIVQYYGIDPRRPGAADSFERAIKEWRVRGIKLHPAVGFYPHDRICYPLYELCLVHELPVLFHSGPAWFHPRLYNRFTHPLEYDQVAADFPRLTIIMGHASGEWWADGLAVARGHPRMFLELSEWQLRLKEDAEAAVRVLDRMRKVVGAERMVWGTDFPGARRLMSLKQCIEVFRQLPTTARRFGVTFTDQEVDVILGGGAAQLLKLA